MEQINYIVCIAVDEYEDYPEVNKYYLTNEQAEIIDRISELENIAEERSPFGTCIKHKINSTDQPSEDEIEESVEFFLETVGEMLEDIFNSIRDMLRSGENVYQVLLMSGIQSSASAEKLQSDLDFLVALVENNSYPRFIRYQGQLPIINDFRTKIEQLPQYIIHSSRIARQSKIDKLESKKALLQLHLSSDLFTAEHNKIRSQLAKVEEKLTSLRQEETT